ncbi:MAG: hypothetical protein IT356_06490 [Gemmatimonadaceae bacterium]|nr:hypothetical protein [Gemmatimonadaceae bacterium]
MRWRWLESPDATGAEQMAVDAGLMVLARETGEAVFRVYGWDRPTLSFGRHESVAGRFDPAFLDARGYGAVRRPTGGRVLLHQDEVTYSVTAPETDGESIRAAFDRINTLLADAIASLGVRPAPAAPAARERRPGADACFAAPSAGELVLDGRKLVASAQRREAGALLQHGSILLADRQGALPELASAGMPAPARGATLQAALGRSVTRDEVRAALRTAVERAHGPLEPIERAEAARYAAPWRAQFADPQWTWRR